MVHMEYTGKVQLQKGFWGDSWGKLKKIPIIFDGDFISELNCPYKRMPSIFAFSTACNRLFTPNLLNMLVI
jgi:hypothetical protein